MAGAGNSMVGSILLFTVVLLLQEVYRGKLASSEMLTILGGFTSSLLFFIGNFQESSSLKSSWGTGNDSCGNDSTVHRVCITTCFLFSAGLLYEMNKISGYMLSKADSKSRRQ
ncbi:hypothetical protein AALP_AA1G236100 [Arabis alpina]|uniref:Uncharacterized protein n=1 Tax=Arabis alpina TaxID=50452 RepID=A0A087HQ66_ARAAL|nr:hypothetical protein AALP_AA1G236100 [Arabis alpina]